MSDQTKNNGEWTAKINVDGKAREIKVHGHDIITNGRKPRYQLIKKDPPGINETELLLEVTFGNNIVDKGTGRIDLYYQEIIEGKVDYKTVKVLKPNGDSVANIEVTPAP